MVPIRRRLSLLCLFSPFRACGGCSSLANITVSYNNRWCTSYRYMDRQQTVGLTSGPVCHVQSPRMSRSNENNIAQVTGEDCPQTWKFWRRVPERRTYLRGKKEMRDSSPPGDSAKKRIRPLPDVAHAADRAAYPSRTTVKFWCGPVEAIRRNSSLAETSLTYPLRKRIEALDGDTRGVGDTRNPSRE